MTAPAFVPLPLAEQHRLIVENIALVHYFANKTGNDVEYEEKVGAGLVGLTIAATKFDHAHGVKFGTYASHWILAHIWNLCIRSAGIPTGTNATKAYFRLRRAIAKCEALGLEPTNERLAKMVNIPPEAVQPLRTRLTSASMSFDSLPLDVRRAPSQRSTRDMLERIAGLTTDKPQEVEYLRKCVARSHRSAIDKALTKLKPREREVIERRFLGDEPVTLQDIGNAWGVSRERVRQVEEVALRKLRPMLVGVL